MSGATLRATPALAARRASRRDRHESRCRAASAQNRRACGACRARPSRRLAEEALADFTREPRAILMGLEQTNHGLVDGFRLLAQVVHFEAGERRRPVERLGDAWDLAQILLAH